MAVYPRGLLSVIESAFGVATTAASEETTATQTVQSTTASGPATTSANPTSTVQTTASPTSDSTNSPPSATTTADASALTSDSSSESTPTSSITSTSSTSPTTSTSSLSTTHPSPSTSTQTTFTTTTPTPTAAPLSSSPSSGDTVSTPGIAVAAIFAALILLGFLYLLWKYLPAARRYRENRYLGHKGPSSDVESTHELFEPKQGLGLGLALRKFSFHDPPAYRSEMLHSDPDLSQHRPLTSASVEHETEHDHENEHIVSPLSTRSMHSQYTLPSALQAGPASYMPSQYPYPYPNQNPYGDVDVRASQIGVAMPFGGNGGAGGGGGGVSRTGSREKGLPPLPLPSIGYGRPSS